jgi:hypothetical protein
MPIIGGPLRYSSAQSLESPSQMGRLPSVGRARCALPARDRPHADADADAIDVLPACLHGTSVRHACPRTGARQQASKQASTRPERRCRCIARAALYRPRQGHMQMPTPTPAQSIACRPARHIHQARARTGASPAVRFACMQEAALVVRATYRPEPGHTNYTASFRPVARRVSCIHVT